MKMKFVLLYVTTANRAEARRIGQILLRERLVACVNLLGPVESQYWWQGKLEVGKEWLLLAKTRATLATAVIRRVKALHSYTTPCVVTLPLQKGNPDFLKWIAAETRAPVSRAARRASRNG
jgi:periplasmic divalent cation tolerance protein